MLNSSPGIPKFEKIQVSTKTFTAHTNIIIDISKLFNIIQITPYVVIPKKRGRKKKGIVVDPNHDIKHGSIITVKFEDKIKGVDLKKKNKKKCDIKWFRNAVTIVIIFDKPINFKVCKNGTFQMTGCKKYKHAEECIKIIWNLIKDDEDMYDITDNSSSLKTIIIPSMRNIDFSLGFTIDREKLNNYICSHRQFYCLLETSFGYTGVNIKIPLANKIDTMIIKKLSYDIGKKKWKRETSTYSEYLNILNNKDRKKKEECKRYSTFLIFHSGKVIMSGLTFEFMKNVYEMFVNLMIEIRPEIEEKLTL
jgi:TATA-box binding protein (TBP) (component of TFIID and TFIIIB)